MGNRSLDTMVREVEVIQIRPNCIIAYPEWLDNKMPPSWSSHIEEANAAKEELYSGELKVSAAKRLKKAVNLLLMSSPKKWIWNPCTQKMQLFQISFLTLTISSKYLFLTAGEAHKALLAPFLDWLRRTCKCNSYIWKAELQQRGQIHYHLTLGSFILHSEIKEKWNYLQRKAGLLEDFNQEYGHYNPNSIDIHTVNKVNDLAGYLCKYIAKAQECDAVMKADCNNDSPMKEEERYGNLLSCYPVNHVHTVRTRGKVWDCSYNLKEGKYWNCVMMPVHKWTLEVAEKEGLVRVIHGDRYKIYFCGHQNPLEVLSRNELNDLKEHMGEISKREARVKEVLVVHSNGDAEKGGV